MSVAQSDDLDSNLAFVQGDTWPGIPLISLTPPPVSQLVSVRMGFRESLLSRNPLITLSTEKNSIVIYNSTDWTFYVPPRFLPLEAGEYAWQLETTDAAGRIRTLFQGTLRVLPDVTTPDLSEQYLYLKWLVSSGCFLSPSIYVYTAYGEPLAIGTSVYSDSELSIPFPSSFSYQDFFYTVSDGDIISTAQCPSDSYGCTESCTDTTPLTLYVRQGDSFPLGSQIFNEANRSSLRTTPFAFGGYLNVPDSSGYVTYQSFCSILFSVATDCFNSPNTPIYIDSLDTLTIGTSVYSDSTLTTLCPLPSIVYGGTIYTLTSGVISGTSSCPAPEVWSVTQGCSSSIFFNLYSASGTTIQSGTAVYTDSFLTVPYANSSFRINVNVYSTDSNGIIYVYAFNTCSSNSYSVLDACGSINPPFNVFCSAFFPETPIPLSTVFYVDTFWTAPYNGPLGTGGTFVLNDLIYTTDSSGAVVSIQPCPSIPSPLTSTTTPPPTTTTTTTTPPPTTTTTPPPTTTTTPPP